MSGSWFPVVPLPDHVLLPHSIINVKVNLNEAEKNNSLQRKGQSTKGNGKETARASLVTRALLQLVLNESRRGGEKNRDRHDEQQQLPTKDEEGSAYADTQDAARAWFFRGPEHHHHDHQANALPLVSGTISGNLGSSPSKSPKWYVRGSGKRENARGETLLCAMSLVQEKEKGRSGSNKSHKKMRKIKALVGGHHLLDLYSVGCVCRILQVNFVQDKSDQRVAIVTLEGLSRVLVKSASIVMPSPASLSAAGAKQEDPAVVMGHCFWPELEPSLSPHQRTQTVVDIVDVRNLAEALYRVQRQVFSDQPKTGEGLGKLVKSLWQMSQLGADRNTNNNNNGKHSEGVHLPLQVGQWATEVADLLLASPLLDGFMSRDQRLEVLESCHPKLRVRVCTAILRGVSRKGPAALPLIKARATATAAAAGGGQNSNSSSKGGRAIQVSIKSVDRSSSDSSSSSSTERRERDMIDDEEGNNEWDELEQKLKSNLPQGSKVRKEAMREFRRIKDAASFRNMPPQPGDNMMRKWLECVADVPWQSNSSFHSETETENQIARSNQHILLRAIQVMDERHYGLKSVKRRIIQYLAVQQLLKETEALQSAKKVKKKGEGEKYDSGSAALTDQSTPFTPNKAPIKNPVILCLVGPPGVGKTSLAQTIAESLQRPMERVSLGGVRDESEIRGHRRTYIGAMPGRIVQAMIRAQTKKPVILLDEIDKAGNPEYGMSVRGDPLGALLEVLDPEQNSSFVDHYVGHALDLSEVFFIATANSLAHMPPALRDRLEIVQLEAYSPQEKGAIAVTHLWPKQLLRHGLGSSDVVTIEPLENRVVEHIAENYTREAGVRQLERCLASICRHIATKVALHREKGSANAATTSPYPSSASSSSPPPDKADIAKFGMEGSSSTTVVDRDQFTNLCFSVDLDLVQEVLGQPKVSRQSYKHLCSRLETPGVAAGLAWTSSGTGTVQLVECCSIARRGESFHNSTTGRLTLTGQLGEVLEESAHIALTLVRSMCSQYLDDPNPQREEYPNQKTKLYEDVMFSDVHVHLPAGSVPKDGPSAGVTLAVALTSLFFGYGCRADTAMTGEISLNGVVLAVGGVAEKVRAANKIGISRVIVPQANEQEARLALRGIKGNDNTGKGGKDETREAAAAASDGAVRTEIIPVKTVSEALEAAIVGGNPWAYHSTSMATAPPMAKL